MTVGCLDKVQGDCSDSSRIFILEKVTKKPDGHRPSFRPFLPLGWMRCSIRAPPLYLARGGIRQAGGGAAAAASANESLSYRALLNA